MEQSEFSTLIEVLRSKALAHEFAAMTSRRESQGDESSKFEMKARSEAFNADQIHATIKILTELKASKTNPPTYIIKPE